MKEYGGYIELEYFNGNILHSDGTFLNSGRSCIAYLLESMKLKRVYLPFFICDSVINVFKRYEIDIVFYNINLDLQPMFENDINDDECFYLVNLYGQLSNETIREYSKKIKNIIVDNTQDYFANPVEGVNTFYICRKYFGVPDGAILFTNLENSSQYTRDIVGDRMRFLIGRFEENASEYYEGYKYSNEYFENKPIMRMSLITENFLRGIDYEEVKGRRTENWNYAVKRFSKYNKLKLKDIKGPFAYPLMIDNGLNYKKVLVSKKVYIPTLWPNVTDECKESLESRMASDIMPIPIDQRYSLEDMANMCDIIERVICEG
ncbi:MAG: hypothetical protein K6B41_03535 [Butyrivibrio sp.]|nr:hypothetical protein [Butyrivibrio sp.]